MLHPLLTHNNCQETIQLSFIYYFYQIGKVWLVTHGTHLFICEDVPVTMIHDLASSLARNTKNEHVAPYLTHKIASETMQ